MQPDKPKDRNFTAEKLFEGVDTFVTDRFNTPDLSPYIERIITRGMERFYIPELDSEFTIAELVTTYSNGATALVYRAKLQPKDNSSLDGPTAEFQFLTDAPFNVDLIHRIVASDLRGSGLATFLYELCEEFLKMKGVKSVTASTSQVGVLKFLDKVGFECLDPDRFEQVERYLKGHTDELKEVVVLREGLQEKYLFEADTKFHRLKDSFRLYFQKRLESKDEKPSEIRNQTTDRIKKTTPVDGSGIRRG